MNVKEKRRSREVQKTAERLHFKFLAMYVEALHNDVHIQAQELYEYVKQKNPGVRDLTKTAEFMKAVMPNKTIPRHYTSKRREHLIRRDATPQTQSCMSRMILNIPLMQLPLNTSQDDVSSQPSPPLNTSQPSPPLNTSQDDVSSQPSPPLNTSQPSPPLNTSQPSPPLNTSQDDVSSQPSPPLNTSQPSPPLNTSQDDVSLPLLPPDVYQTLLDELKKDPDLWRIMNDFQDNTYDMDDFVANDMGDIFMADDLSPLEIELEGVFENIV